MNNPVIAGREVHRCKSEMNMVNFDAFPAADIMVALRELCFLNHYIIYRHVLVAAATASFDLSDLIHDIGTCSYFAKYTVTPAL